VPPRVPRSGMPPRDTSEHVSLNARCGRGGGGGVCAPHLCTNDLREDRKMSISRFTCQHKHREGQGTTRPYTSRGAQAGAGGGDQALSSSRPTHPGWRLEGGGDHLDASHFVRCRTTVMEQTPHKPVAVRQGLVERHDGKALPITHPLPPPLHTHTCTLSHSRNGGRAGWILGV
jgi:hypothetical protein